MIDRYQLNTFEPKELSAFRQPHPDDYPTKTFKNKRLEDAYRESNEYCRAVLDLIVDNIKTFMKYQLVDIKFHELEPGDSPANGLWHLDSGLNPTDKFDNYLFVSGVNNTTEFIRNEMSIRHHNSIKSFNDDIESRAKAVFKIKPCVVTNYNESNVHRSPRCTHYEDRVLIRLINTNKLLPTSGI